MITSQMLAGLDLFKGLPQATLESIAACCKEESFPAGTMFFAVDRPADRTYLLLEGTVKLTISPFPQPSPVTLSVLNKPGQIFGWSALVGPRQYTAAATASTAVRAVAVEGQALMAYLQRDTAAGFVIMTRLAELISQRMSELRRTLIETIRECDQPAEAVQEN